MEKLVLQNVTQYFLEICNVCEGSDPDSPWSFKQVMQYFPAIGNNCAWSMNDMTNIVATDRNYILWRKPLVTNIHKRINDNDKNKDVFVIRIIRPFCSSSRKSKILNIDI